MTTEVVRVWKGYGTPEGVERYCREHLVQTVLPQLQALDGFLAADVLVRSLGDEDEVVVATTWESIEAVKRFAGDDYERAVVEPVARRLLTRFDASASHFALALSRRVPS
jgi:heme-degrading monooxygenase HmoA